MAGSFLRPPAGSAGGALRSTTPRSHRSSPVNAAAAVPAAAIPAAALPATARPIIETPVAPPSPLPVRSRPGSRSSRSPFPSKGRASFAPETPTPQDAGGKAEKGEEQQQEDPTSSFASAAQELPEGRSRGLVSVLNFSFSLLLCVAVSFVAAAAGKIWLPQRHALRRYAELLLKHAPPFGGAFVLFRLTPVLQRAAATAAKEGHKALAEWLYAAADHPLTDTAFVLLFTLALTFFFVFILRGLRAYKRERDLETCPPATMYCTNLMTAEEFSSREATYKALAELMKDPEYLRMKGMRATGGPAAWNWQLRARVNPEELLQEELGASSGEEGE